MSVILDYYNRESTTITTESGFIYDRQESVKKEEKPFESKEEAFKFLYHENNRLKYCNGCYWELQDESLNEDYKKFLKEYNTITNYYNGGIVD